jgi:hypothetical protein
MIEIPPDWTTTTFQNWTTTIKIHTKSGKIGVTGPAGRRTTDDPRSAIVHPVQFFRLSSPHHNAIGI